jgi:hypothetical protein
MSLDNFQLPIPLLPEFYSNSLVVLDGQQINEKSLKETTFKFLGGNERKILILVNDPENLHLGDSELAFLNNVLSACKLHLGDVALVNWAQNTQIDFQLLFDFFEPQLMLSFDVDIMNIAPKKYELCKIKNIDCLFSSSLKNIAINTEEKKSLWNTLKSYFKI